MIYAINMPAWIYILARTTANFGIFTTRAQFQPLFRPTHFLKPRWIKKRFHCLYRFRNSTSVIGTKWEERVTLTWLSVLFLLASLCSVLSAFCTGFFWGGRGLQIKYILGIAISNNSGIYTLSHHSCENLAALEVSCKYGLFGLWWETLLAPYVLCIEASGNYACETE